MEIAIDRYNQELDESDNSPSGFAGSSTAMAGEAMIKQVAHMFKIIGMEEDGMRFYTNFIMIGQHSQGMATQASHQSTMKQIENVLIDMYEDFERVSE